jgi:hypothetical protein
VDRVSAFAVACCLALVACSALPAEPGSGPVRATGTVGPEELSETAAADLREAVADHLVEESAELLKAVRIGGAAFAVATAHGDQGREETFLSLKQGGSGWRVQDAAPIRAFPARGSNGFAFQTLVVGALVAHGGFVDPTASLVDAVDPFGHVVDADSPFAGAVLLVSDRFGLLRIHRGSRIIGALQVIITSAEELALLQPTVVEPSFREDARDVADAFVEAFLSDGWESATTHYNPDGRPDLLLPPLEEVVEPGEWDVNGLIRSEPRGFLYPISSAGEEAFLHVQVILHLGEWKVTGVAVSTPPEVGGSIG